jgi:predicted short-subunit dehydrogenase-like oxidoreductase (DUF2520 family)
MASRSPQGLPPEGPALLDSFNMVGTGAMARALGRALLQHGFRCASWFGRTADHARQAAGKEARDVAVVLGSQSLPPADLTFIAVADDAVQDVAFTLTQGHVPSGSVILHTSGVHDRRVLDALAAKGAVIGSFHPLQSFIGTEGKERFRGITIGVEGMPGAVSAGKRLADDLLAQSVEVSTDHKALYHAAAAMAGNHAIAMLAVAADLWERATSDRQGAVEALGPLTRQSVENALHAGPEVALTGPVVRGDLGTLQRHLDALSQHAEHLLPMYAAVVTETVHLAMKSGRLSTEKAVEMLDLMARGVGTPTEET